jgi:FG-GAP-like repeat
VFGMKVCIIAAAWLAGTLRLAGDAPASVGANAPPSGEQLARTYCQVCHLFPDPNLLDKSTWINGVSRRMAPLMGVARLNFDKRPDGAILRDSELFPTRPMLPESEWRAIWTWYRDSAPAVMPPQPPHDPVAVGLKGFAVRAFANPAPTPATTLVKIDPASRRIFAGDADARSLNVFKPDGRLEFQFPVESGPSSLTVRPEGVYVTLIGHVFPSDLPEGKLLLLHEGPGGFKAEILLEHLRRPSDTLVTDLNGDGRPDFVVSEFGNYVGGLTWFENVATGGFEARPLIDRPGALGAVLWPRRDAKVDIITLMAQAREGVYRLTNAAAGVYRPASLVDFPPVHGSTHMELVDMNGDGFPDLLVTNGDNGEYASPFKPYHGVRILLNDGLWNFHEAWFYPINGAFKAVAADFDGDGDLDVAVIAFFADYDHNPAESFVYFENLGGLRFKPSTFEGSDRGRWLTMDVGDIDGDGDTDIVLGGFTEGPPSIAISDAVRQRWRTNNTAVLVLENTKR